MPMNITVKSNSDKVNITSSSLSIIDFNLDTTHSILLLLLTGTNED